jgi:LysR family pca operon transcriptional activator
MAIDPKRLLELLSIAESGSFTKAAATRRVSQPALSNSIAVLEKALGVRVLERSRSGAALTDYGRLLSTHAQALSALLARAAEDVRLKKDGLEGVLTIGASPLACVTLVPSAVSALERASPNIRVEIREGPDDELVHGLRTGALDLTVSPAGPESDPADIARESLMHDLSVVLVRKRHPLTRRRHLTLSDLRDARWVFPSPHTAMWRHIEALFMANDLPWPAHYVTTNSILAVRSLVMGSDSVTVSSTNVMKLEQTTGQLVALRLRKPLFVREIVLRRRRHVPLTPLGERLAAALRAEAAHLRRRA